MSNETYRFELLLARTIDPSFEDGAPEVVDAVDEFVLDDNPEIKDELTQKARRNYNADTRLAWLGVEVPRAAVDAVFITPTVAGTII